MLERLRRLFAIGPSSQAPLGEARGADTLQEDCDALKAECDRLAALVVVQENRALVALQALETARARIDEFELELYVARSDQQRAAVIADELRRTLTAQNV